MYFENREVTQRTRRGEDTLPEGSPSESVEERRLPSFDVTNKDNAHGLGRQRRVNHFVEIPRDESGWRKE